MGAEDRMKRRHFLLSLGALVLRPWKWLEPLGFHQRNALANEFTLRKLSPLEQWTQGRPRVSIDSARFHLFGSENTP